MSWTRIVIAGLMALWLGIPPEGLNAQELQQGKTLPVRIIVKYRSATDPCSDCARPAGPTSARSPLAALRAELGVREERALFSRGRVLQAQQLRAALAARMERVVELIAHRERR